MNVLNYTKICFFSGIHVFFGHVFQMTVCGNTLLTDGTEVTVTSGIKINMCI